MIIGVTDEPPALVDRWVDDVRPIYPIVATESRELMDFLGVRGFPTAAVVSPEGVLEFAGYGNYKSPLEESLDRAEKGGLLPKALSKVQKKVDVGDREGAYEELVKLLEAKRSKLDEAETAVAQRWRAWIEDATAAEVAEAQQLLEDGWVYKAHVLVEPLAESKAGFPATQDAQTVLEQLEALEHFKDEMKGGEMFAEAEPMLRSKSKREDGLELLDKIARKYEDRRIGEHARQTAESVRGQ